MHFFLYIDKLFRNSIVIYFFALCFLLLIFQGVHAAPQRVISTSPAITEILFALGAGDRVVGVNPYCSFSKKTWIIARICCPLKTTT